MNYLDVLCCSGAPTVGCIVQVGGVLLVAPEHRSSMFLKHLELSMAADEDGPDLGRKLLWLLNNFSCYDLLDESDEVLHHQ
jgi:hypothetical protein